MRAHPRPKDPKQPVRTMAVATAVATVWPDDGRAPRRTLMKYALRAFVSALMLAGACVLIVAAVLAVATGLFVALATGGAWAVLAGIVAVAVLAAVALMVLHVRRRLQTRLAGVPVTSDDQPLLWMEVYRVAEGLGMRPPDELLLAPDATVVASESRTWLPRRPGARRLQLGEVLLAGLTERQLRAVIAREFCRCWGPTSLGWVVHRGNEVIGRVVDLVGEDSRAGRIARRYGRVYAAVSRPVTRRHELEADRLSAEFVGNAATSSALREVAVLSKGWDAFVDAYAVPAAAMHRRPKDLFAGFGCFIEEPTRRAQLAETVGEEASQPQSKYDIHPSLGDRLAAIASLPDDDMHDKSGRALGLLRHSDREIRRVEDCMFQDPDLMPSTWEEIVPEAGRAAAREDALKLVRLGREGGLGPTLSVETLLDIVRLELADEMVRPLLGEGAPPEAERQLVGRLVTAFLATAAIGSGTVSYRLSWVGPWQLVDGRGEVEDLPRLVDAALADPVEVGALELWLSTHQLGLELELGEDPLPILMP